MLLAGFEELLLYTRYTVQRWSLRWARDARSPRCWVSSGARRYLPGVVTIKRRSDGTTTRRRHVTRPLLNTQRILILDGRLKNYRSNISSSSSWGEQNQLLMLLLRRRATFCDQGRYVHLVPRLHAGAEPTKSSKAGHLVPDKLQERQPIHLYIIDVIWDPWRSLMEKRHALSDFNLTMGFL